MGFVKPESTEFVDKAHRFGRADRMLAVGLNEDAARTAYLACFHVAQAYIFERTDKTSKSHHGVQTEFFRLTREDDRADAGLRRFLSKAYEIKSVADYFTGEQAVTSVEDAAAAVATAENFMSHFGAII